MIKKNHKNGLIFYQSDILQVSHALFTRHGGVSNRPYSYLNCSHGVGDDTATVSMNRQRMKIHRKRIEISSHDDSEYLKLKEKEIRLQKKLEEIDRKIRFYPTVLSFPWAVSKKITYRHRKTETLQELLKKLMEHLQEIKTSGSIEANENIDDSIALLKSALKSQESIQRILWRDSIYKRIEKIGQLPELLDLINNINRRLDFQKREGGNESQNSESV